MTTTAAETSVAAVADEVCRDDDAGHGDGVAARRAEVATALRLAAAASLTGRVCGDTAIEAQLSSREAAVRLCAEIAALYGIVAEFEPAVGSLRRGQHVVRIVDRVAELARRTRLADSAGRWVRGLPPPVVAGPAPVLVAAWRAAVLTAPSLARRGGVPGLEIACPNPETAIALAGAARRIEVTAGARTDTDQPRVLLVRDEDARRLLWLVGAPNAARAWSCRSSRGAGGAGPERSESFDGANRERSTQAAVQATARVRRAFAILGDTAPAPLQEAGRLRLTHPQICLDELGRLAEPALSKHAVAGRLRRLLDTADRRAADLAVPDTFGRSPGR